MEFWHRWSGFTHERLFGDKDKKNGNATNDNSEARLADFAAEQEVWEKSLTRSGR
jgi:hypothetical protein